MRTWPSFLGEGTLRSQWEEEGSRSFEEISAFLRCERKLRTGMGSEASYDFWENSLPSSLPCRFHLGKPPRSISTEWMNTQWVSTLAASPKRPLGGNEYGGECAYGDLGPLEQGEGSWILFTLSPLWLAFRPECPLCTRGGAHGHWGTRVIVNCVLLEGRA